MNDVAISTPTQRYESIQPIVAIGDITTGNGGKKVTHLLGNSSHFDCLSPRRLRAGSSQ